MPRFLVIFRDVRSDEVPYLLLFPLLFETAELAPRKWSSEIELELNDQQLSAIREAITDPVLRRHLPPEGQNLHTIISLYFQQELKRIAPAAARVRVVQIPEPLPAETEKDAGELVSCGNPGCPHCNPANPANKDPWARGY